MSIDDCLTELSDVTKHWNVGGNYCLSESQLHSLLRFAHTAGLQEGIREVRRVEADYIESINAATPNW